MSARRRLASALLVVAVLFAGAVAPIAAAIPGELGRAHLRLGYHPRHWSGDPRLAPLARELFRRGYLVPDAAVYERAKARAARRIQATRVSRDEKAPSRTPLPPNTPSVARSWEGTFDSRSTPSDSTGAIGPTRYIELVNTKFAIYE